MANPRNNLTDSEKTIYLYHRLFYDLPLTITFSSEQSFVNWFRNKEDRKAFMDIFNAIGVKTSIGEKNEKF